jgi:hypothetical protein
MQWDDTVRNRRPKAALPSGSSARKDVRVRIPASAPTHFPCSHQDVPTFYDRHSPHVTASGPRVEGFSIAHRFRLIPLNCRMADVYFRATG